MSRTDVHAPSWVKERDASWRDNYVESHNHSWYVTGYEKYTNENGFTAYKPIWKIVDRCDLDVYLTSREWVRTACRMQYVNNGKNIDCGCKMCSGQVVRRKIRRAERQETKRLIRSGRWEDILPSRYWKW